MGELKLKSTSHLFKNGLKIWTSFIKNKQMIKQMEAKQTQDDEHFKEQRSD